ncbi:50S ribosomal protein L33 [Candidatus Falkowbacteria bacterium]|nr:50S ribosomal protein L33 [Candidatus Falkowbacteria bacterium]
MAKRTEDKYVKLECKDCKQINYRTHKNKRILKTRLEMKKFCAKCNKHTLHKETK